MNQIIEQVLSGYIGMDVFLEELQTNYELQKYICNFIPEDAKDNPAHNFWQVVPYQSLQQNNFDYYKFLFWALHSHVKFAIHLNVFSRLRKAYRYYHPEVECTSRYDDEFDIYLDAVKDCFDGPEVQTLVEQIITDSMQLPSKAKRIKQAKATVSANFHVENNRRPRWVQGPEWPMGVNSPMAFIAQKKAGDLVNFEFKDVDTGYTRIVKQYY